MKMGIFTDSHYSSAQVTCHNRYNSESLRKIEEAFHLFKKENCDIAVSLGDLIDCEDEHSREVENLKKISGIIEASHIPTVAVMGNHDAFAFTREEFYEILGMNCRPYNRCMDGKKLVFLDACYFKNGNHYVPGDSDWTDTFLPDVVGFQREISQCKGDTYVFLHQNIDPTLPKEYRLSNADEICNIIENTESVRGVYQGHYHNGSRFERNGTSYITFPAMCSFEDAYYIIDI